MSTSIFELVAIFSQINLSRIIKFKSFYLFDYCLSEFLFEKLLLKIIRKIVPIYCILSIAMDTIFDFKMQTNQ